MLLSRASYCNVSRCHPPTPIELGKFTTQTCSQFQFTGSKAPVLG